jgi:hypothetical protein
MIETFLPLTLWDSGAPLAAAAAGVFAYRFFNLWVPLPPAVLSLPTLRRIGRGEAEQDDAALNERIWRGAKRLVFGPRAYARG